MKFFKNTNIWQKLVIALLVVICFQVMFVPTVEAAGAAGILFEPINMIVLFIGDGIMSLLHLSVMGQEETTINISVTDSWFWAIIVAVIAIVVIVVIFVSGGTALAALVAAIKTYGIAVATIGAVLFIGVDLLDNGILIESPTMVYEIDNVPNELVLPLYSLSPEEIFKNQIGLFNVNFFNPEASGGNATHAWAMIPDGGYESIENWILAEDITESEYSYYSTSDFENIKVTNDFEERMEKEHKLDDVLNQPTHLGTYGDGGETTYISIDDVKDIDLNNSLFTKDGDNENYHLEGFYIKNEQNQYTHANSVDVNSYRHLYVKKIGSGGYEAYPVNEIPIGAAVQYYFYLEEGGDITNKDDHTETSKINIAAELQPTISKWYVALRNLAIILMLTILLYIGIRMMLTSVAAEKSKYKQMLTSWFIGMCLLVFIHYLMVFSVTIVESFTRLISDSTEESVTRPYNLIIKNINEDGAKEEAITNAMDQIGEEGYITDFDGEGGENDFIWISSNILGQYRMAAQMSVNSASQLMYTIGFIVLVIYTLIFSYIYLKRVLYLAFLTIIAPLVAMTYPIDTIGDGQAQGFNKWLREYLFNLLMQPFHLLLYTILIASSLELSNKNMLYMLVALGFLIPAEKFLRSLFGFSKSETAGSFAGSATGAALMMGAVNKAIGMGKGGKGKASSSGGSDSGGNDSGSIRYSGSDPLEDIFASDNGSSNINNSLPLNMSGNNQSTNQPGGSNNSALNSNSSITLNPNGTTSNSANQGSSKSNSANQGSSAGTNLGNPTIAVPKTNKNKKLLKLKRPPTKASGPTKAKSFKNKIKQNLFDNKKEYWDGVRRRAKGVGAFAGTVSKSAGKGIKKGFEAAPRTIIKGAGGMIAGGVAGSLGLAAAIASGDAGNVIKYGGGAAVAGGAVGANLAGKVLDQKNNKAIQRAVEEYRRAAYTQKEYDEQKEKREYEEWIDNTEAMYKLEDKFGRVKVKEMMNDGTLKTYHENGFTNARDIKKLEKMRSKGIAQNATNAVAVHKLATTYGNVHQDKKKEDNALEKLRKSYVDKGVSNPEELSKKAVEKISKAYENGLI